MIYILVLCVLIFFSLLEFCDFKELYAVKKLSLDKIVFVFTAFLMFCIAAFRYKTGRDWQNYIEFFDKCIISKNNFGFETGFSFINRFFKKTIGSFYFLQFLTMSFCCYFTYKSFLKRSSYPCFTLFLYFTLFFLQTDMAQTRQHIAMAIILCGTKFIESRRFILWTCIIFLAMQFHITALLAFPIYFTLNRKISVKFCIFLFLTSIFITFFGLNLIRWMLSTVTNFSIVPERIRAIGNFYLNSKIYGLQGQFGSGLGFFVRYGFIALMIFFYELICKNKYTEEKQIDYYFFNFLIALIFQAMGRNFDQFSRISNYYLICGGGICAYNLLLDAKFFFKKLEFVKTAICVLFLLFMFFNFWRLWTVPSEHFNSYQQDYTPYRSIIFKDN